LVSVNMLFGVMVGLFTQHVVMLNVISLNVIMLSMFKLSVIIVDCCYNKDSIRSVIMLSVIM
jgi:hypothetical protein